MILLDRRIGSSDLYQPLRAFGLPVELTTLDVGDVAWIGRGLEDAPVPVGVEIKRIGDLLSSILSGRLSGHQLPQMVKQYVHTYLLIEGRYRVGEEGIIEMRNGSVWMPHQGTARHPFTYRELEAFLTTLEIRAGVHLRRTVDRPETAALVHALYRWWTSKPLEDHGSHLAMHSAMRDSNLIYKPTLKRRVAAELPGVGVERSGAVADHFPSVKAMVEAEVKEWETIPGIGKTLARKIRTALNE